MGATRGQHYLPQLLLRGFASRIKEKKTWVYLFRQDINGKEVSIKDIGKETDFHGNPSDSGLETKMSIIESAFSPHVARWRKGEFLVGHDEGFASEFVGHLIVRTKSVRDTFAGAGQALLDEVLGRFDEGKLDLSSPPEYESEILGRISHNPLIANFIRQNPRKARRIVKAELSKAKKNGQILKWGRYAAQGMRAGINVKEAMAQAHIDALDKNQIPPARVQILQKLRWSVVITPNPRDLILGDIGAIAREAGVSGFKHPLAIEFNNIEMLCCPIGSGSALLALANGIDHPFLPDEINMASAELSRDFFVAAESNQRLRALQTVLGKRAEILSPDEIRGLIPEKLALFRSSDNS